MLTLFLVLDGVTECQLVPLELRAAYHIAMYECMYE
jgi:hypothetical protein